MLQPQMLKEKPQITHFSNFFLLIVNVSAKINFVHDVRVYAFCKQYFDSHLVVCNIYAKQYM